MSKFYDRLRKTKAYAEIVGGDVLSPREKSLLLLAAQQAENEIGRLKVELEQGRSKTEIAQMQTRVALLLSNTANVARKGALLLVSPFDTYPELLSGKQTAPHAQRSREEVELAQGLNEAGFAPKSPQRAILSLLPKALHDPVLYVSNYITKLSPITLTALTFLAVVLATTFAEYRYGGIENSYKLTVQRNADLEKRVAAGDEAQKQLKEATAAREKAEGEAGRLQSRVESLRAELLREQERYATLAQQARSDLEAARSNLDASTRETLKRSDQRIVQLESDLKTARDEAQQSRERLVELQTRLATSPDVRNQIADLNRTITQREDRIVALEALQQDYVALQAFTHDMSRGVERLLLTSDTRYITRSRDEFRALHKNIYSQREATFQRLGLQRF